jgi:hypothetical protein
MCIGHAAKSIALAASAGFMKFCPNPPNACFTKAIAANDPMAGIHNGTVDGNVYESNNPVTTALKSLIVIGFFLKNRMTASVNTAERTEIPIIKRTLAPKKYTDATAAGTKAKITSSITLDTDFLSQM